MSEITKFKVGDKVRYKESEKRNAEYNGHDFNEIYTVSRLGSGSVVFFVESPDQGCYKHRLELVNETQETFDYKQALKILAENPETILESSTNGSSWLLSEKYDVISIYKHSNVVYRVKPSPKPTYHWLIKSKGKFTVTTKKYASEEDVKAGYSYPVKVIQKLED